MISVYHIQNAKRHAIIATDVENITIKLGKRQSIAILTAIRNFISLRLKETRNLERKELIAFFGEHPENKKAYLKKVLKSLGFNIRIIKLKPPYHAEQIDHALLSYLHGLARKNHKTITDIILIASDNDYANALAEIQKKWRENNIGRVIVVSRENSSRLRKWASEFWRITLRRSNTIVSLNQKDLKVFTVNGYTIAFERLEKPKKLPKRKYRKYLKTNKYLFFK